MTFNCYYVVWGNSAKEMESDNEDAVRWDANADTTEKAKNVRNHWVL